MSKAAAGKRRSYGFAYAALGFLLACIIFRAWSNSSNGAATAPPRTGSLSFGMMHAQAEDAKWLGPQKGDAPPARLDSYKYKTNKYQARDSCAGDSAPMAATQHHTQTIRACVNDDGFSHKELGSVATPGSLRRQ